MSASNTGFKAQRALESVNHRDERGRFVLLRMAALDAPLEACQCRCNTLDPRCKNILSILRIQSSNSLARIEETLTWGEYNVHCVLPAEAWLVSALCHGPSCPADSRTWGGSRTVVEPLLVDMQTPSWLPSACEHCLGRIMGLPIFLTGHDCKESIISIFLARLVSCVGKRRPSHG
jgi:hypothetical protein